MARYRILAEGVSTSDGNHSPGDVVDIPHRVGRPWTKRGIVEPADTDPDDDEGSEGDEEIDTGNGGDAASGDEASSSSDNPDGETG